MNPTDIEGVFEKNGKIFTENLESCRGIKVYNEKLILYNNREFRSWNPYRSKLAAVILKGYKNINITSKSQLLYLGASTGTTISHISDIAKNGMVYAVENSPFSVKKLKICSRMLVGTSSTSANSSIILSFSVGSTSGIFIS